MKALIAAKFLELPSPLRQAGKIFTSLKISLNIGRGREMKEMDFQK